MDNIRCWFSITLRESKWIWRLIIHSDLIHIEVFITRTYSGCWEQNSLNERATHERRQALTQKDTWIVHKQATSLRVMQINAQLFWWWIIECHWYSLSNCAFSFWLCYINIKRIFFSEKTVWQWWFNSHKTTTEVCL